MKLREIAEMLGGELAGGPDIEIKGAAGYPMQKTEISHFFQQQGLLKNALRARRQR